MPATVYVEIDGQRVPTRDAAAYVGISRSQMSCRIREGRPVLAPKRHPQEAARSNPDPFGWSWRRRPARALVTRTCDCGRTFTVTEAICRRGRGVSCSKSCAAIRRENARKAHV